MDTIADHRQDQQNDDNESAESVDWPDPNDIDFPGSVEQDTFTFEVN